MEQQAHKSVHPAAHTPVAKQVDEHGHRHLTVVGQSAPRQKVTLWRRWLVIAVTAAAVALFVLSFTKPYWDFWLYAPQYPRGLRVTIGLTGVTGDVREIDVINHYIGMGHLTGAAKAEREFAAFGIAGIAFLVVATVLFAGRKLGKLAILPGLGLPIAFVADTFYWMYRFGHDLDPHAPIHVQPFTPTVLGNGEIGQFMSYAAPASGYYMALGGVGLLAVAVYLRSRVCNDCSQAGTCGAVCKSAFVLLPEKPGTGHAP